MNDYIDVGPISCRFRQSEKLSLSIRSLPHPITMATTPTVSSYVTQYLSLSRNMSAEQASKLMTCNLCSIAQCSEKLIQQCAIKSIVN